jgi:hypothetical protein
VAVGTISGFERAGCPGQGAAERDNPPTTVKPWSKVVSYLSLFTEACDQPSM